MSRTPSRVEVVFADALLLPAHERAAFLDGACGGDTALRARLDALLAAHDGPESVMTSSPVGAWPFSRLAEKPGDHWVFWHRPEEVTQVIQQFLASL